MSHILGAPPTFLQQHHAIAIFSFFFILFVYKTQQNRLVHIGLFEATILYCVVSANAERHAFQL